MAKATRNTILSFLILGLAGCGGSPERGERESFYGREAEYRASRSLPPLEVPPDLVRPTEDAAMGLPAVVEEEGTATYSGYAGVRPAPAREPMPTPGVLPPVSGARVERGGAQRWLVVDASPSEVWPKLREFWIENGLTIEREDPAIGIMETQWAENRANIDAGGIRRLIEKVTPSVYSSAYRDKFRARLEPGLEAGSTELYVSHRGVEEVSQGERFVWQLRPSDPDLEAEMLYRLLVYFGTRPQQAQQLMDVAAQSPPQARLTRDAQGPVLELEGDFGRGWQRTGLALDRVGFTVTDRDRSRGLYYVRYADAVVEAQEKGLLTRLKFWGEDDVARREAEYRVSLQATEGEPLLLVVLDGKGNRETSPTAERMLKLLHEQLK